MKSILVLSINSLLMFSGASQNSTKDVSANTLPRQIPMVVPVVPLVVGVAPSRSGSSDSVETRVAKQEPIPLIVKSEHVVPEFAPDLPATFLNLAKTTPVRPTIFDGTEYGESVERLVPREPRAKHFLRQSENPRSIDKERQSSLDVDETEKTSSDFGIEEGFKYVVSAIETLPTHPAVEEAVQHIDSWAQEAKAGFMGYWERLSSLWRKESKTVGHKLFDVADAYSHRFFTLLRVKETDHPVLAAKVTRIILAMGLSLTLVFLIFGLALQLQKSIVARAHEEAGKQQPRIVQGEQLFFAMPYPHSQSVTDNIVVVDRE